MKRNSRNTSNTVGTDEHLDAVGPLLTQLRTHLTDSGASKGTYADYLRLLEFYRNSRGEQARELIVTWVDPDLEPELNLAA